MKSNKTQYHFNITFALIMIDWKSNQGPLYNFSVTYVLMIDWNPISPMKAHYDLSVTYTLIKI